MGLALLALHASAAVLYVDLNSASPAPPYAGWDTAATNIQDAVDAATDGDLILVTNGTYAGGARVTPDSATNRVVVTKPVVVQSVNGPAVTVIDGATAARCVNLGAGAQLSGFTLENGYSIVDAGGVYCQDTTALVTNCLLTGNYASGNGGGISGGTVFNSTLTNNSAGNNGGGAQSATLNHCTLAGNSAVNGVNANGGGANASVLNNCTLAGNWAGGSGFGSAISGPQPAFLVSYFGGGAEGSTLNNCTLIANQSEGGGGGADSSILNNCVVADNAAGYGGGVENCTLNNCTVTGNSGSEGINIGGAQDSTLNNSIVYYNTNGGDYGNSTLNYCCTASDPGGTGNITNEPAFVNLAGGNFHLQTGSPCINAGNNSPVTTTNDLDGNPRILGLVVDLGAYEFPIPAAIAASYTNVAVGFAVNFNWQEFAGNVSEIILDFGDGIVLTNPVTAMHSWAAPGTFTVTLTAFSDQFPAGANATLAVDVVEGNYFVSLNNTNPVAPYTSWDTAATNIQDAVDAAVAGGTVLASNGVYNVGGRVVFGAMTNRVAADKPVTIQSVNGPGLTAIEGFTANDGTSIRCIYLTNNAALIGFTLTNGGTIQGGDYVHEWNGAGAWCESSSVVVSNCIFVNNTAQGDGGGIYGGTLFNCAFTNNYGYDGGAASYSALKDCALANNRSYYGGGAYGSTLTDCLITGNFTYVDSDATANGGGACASTLANCVLSGNSSITGGGASGCTLFNSLLTGNVAQFAAGWWPATGGGAYGSALINCTVTGNTAANGGGGVNSCTLTNCIVNFNTAPSGTNYSDDSVLSYCDTTPLATNGVNNISTDPLFADSIHISSTSPCRGAGIFSATSGVDIDGDAWLNPPSIGVDEFDASSATGALAVAIFETFTNVATGLAVDFTAQVSGHAADNRWDFGDGTVLSNELTVSHSWVAPGNCTVTFTAFNTDHPAGVSASVTIFVMDNPVHYVTSGNLTPTAPYLSWATAAANIQDAVDAAYAGGTILVSNGIYQAGGRIVSGLQSNRVVVAKPLLVRSVNGPMFTTIQGNSAPDDSAVRCVYLTNRVTLAGFTLNGGRTRTTGDMDQTTGGGAWCGDASVVISNCVFSGNSAMTAGGGVFQGTVLNCWFLANKSSANGGGANSATLFNCALTGNSAGANGGGAEGCTLANCTLTRNFASGSGGGVDGSTLTNCIVYFNDALGQPDYSWSSFNYCCTTPLADDAGNITSAPLLLDSEHVASGSPCIGAGNMAAAIGADIDGDAWRMPPSIGCDEFYSGVAGTLGVAIQSDYTNFAPNFAVNFYEVIVGHSSASRWDFGDGSSVTNQLLASHSWSAPGNYAVTFTAFNNDNPTGVSAAMIVYVASNAVHYVSLASTNPVAPFLTWETAATNIQDAVDAATVPGALVLATNGIYQSGSRVTNGSYQVLWYSVGESETNRLMVAKVVTVASVNGAASTVIDGAGVVRCVYLGTGATLQGFTLTNGYVGGDGGGAWCSSRKAIIRDCALVNNYAVNWGGGVSGGCLSNCIVTGNYAYNGVGAESSTLISCAVTGNNSSLYKIYFGWYVVFASGGGVDNCVATDCAINNNRSWYGCGASSSTLYHCTLNGNYSSGSSSSGGAYGCTLNRCTLSGNSAANGGGVSQSTVNNCIIAGNAANGGGGGISSTLNNCTLIGNYNYFGGPAVNACVMNNCISYYNGNGDYDSACTLTNCCVEADPGGVGNITNAPLFVNQNTSDYHLQTNSPCINSGNNAYTVGTNDLDGLARVTGGTVDIGAYEFQTPSSILSYAWAQQFGLPTDGSADKADADGDGLSNWQEWRAGTDPTNAASLLRMLSTTNDPSGTVVTWQSVSGVNYFIQSSGDLSAQPPFITIQSNIVGQAGTTSFTDTTATNGGPYFYRVGVQ